MQHAQLQPVDTVLLLQSSPLLERATASQLVGLASLARPISLKKGVDPLAGGTASILVMLSGELKIEREGNEPETAAEGDVVGIYETLAGATFPVRAEVVSEGQALRFLGTDVLDLLADDIGLLRGIFSGLLRVPEGLTNSSQPAV